MRTALEICPAPWTSKDDGPTLGEQARPNVYDANDTLVAAVATKTYVDPNDSCDPETLAIGRFIKAAPAMYYLLIAARDHIRAQDDDGSRAMASLIDATITSIDGVAPPLPENGDERQPIERETARRDKAGRKARSKRESDAMLAGLRLLATALRERLVLPNDGEIGDILTSAGDHDGLTSQEVDELADGMYPFEEAA